jgi:hypothetical protein
VDGELVERYAGDDYASGDEREFPEFVIQFPLPRLASACPCARTMQAQSVLEYHFAVENLSG